MIGTGDISSILQMPIPQPIPMESEEYVYFEGYWVSRGTLEPEIDEKVNCFIICINLI